MTAATHHYAYFPAFVDVSNAPAVLVGGSEEAARKLRLLLQAKARVRVIAADPVDEIDGLAREGRIELHRRNFRDEDVADAVFVISATGEDTVDEAVAEAARRAGRMVNVVDRQDLCSFIVPSIVDRSPILVAISSFGTAPVLARRIREKLEAELPRNLGRLAAFAGRFRAAVQSVVPRRLRRYFWEDVFSGEIAAKVLDGREGEAADAMLVALNSVDEKAAGRGSVTLVGAGPGASDLLTLRGLNALQSADVVVHDKLVSDEVLALARRDADRISVGKAKGAHSASQDDINRLLVDLARQGKRVVRLKGGDPFVFGRGGEEQAVLRAAAIPVTVVPGVTAAVACGAATGIPLTHRGAAQAVTFVTGHPGDGQSPVDWAPLAGPGRTLAVYMGKTAAGAIARELQRAGLAANTPVAVVVNGTLSAQRVLTGRLSDLEHLSRLEKLDGPALLIIGEVARECTDRTAEDLAGLIAGDSTLRAITA